MASLTETILRDAHQSLFATRMRLDDMLIGAQLLDRIGLRSVEMWGGATFDVCLRYLNENPWERLKQIKERLKKTPTQMLLRGQNLVGYEHYADDVVDLFVATAAKNGMDIFRVFDALNDVRNMERAIRAVLHAGKRAQGTLCYTRSPVHRIEDFVALAADLRDLGCSSICVKDMAGLLRPGEAHELVSALCRQIRLPIQVHTHNTAGYAQATYFAALEAGAEAVDCALSPLANGSSQPSTEAMLDALRGTRFDPGYPAGDVEEAARYFRTIRAKYESLIDPILERVDVRVLEYQIPGGMISNLLSQLREQGHLEKLDAVLAEVPRVRRDLGWPPLVTPTSQIVGNQAVLNVVGGEPYKLAAKETRKLAFGHYGKTPAPVNPELLKKLEDGFELIDGRPADKLEPLLPKIRAAYPTRIRSDEDLLILALFPGIGERFLSGQAVAEALPEPRRSVEDDLHALNLVIEGRPYHVELKRMEKRCVAPVDVPPAPTRGETPTRPEPRAYVEPGATPSGERLRPHPRLEEKR